MSTHDMPKNEADNPARVKHDTIYQPGQYQPEDFHQGTWFPSYNLVSALKDRSQVDCAVNKLVDAGIARNSIAVLMSQSAESAEMLHGESVRERPIWARGSSVSGEGTMEKVREPSSPTWLA
jgi:hypothetical protein